MVDIGLLEQAMSEEHFVEDVSKRPDIRFSGVGFSLEDLGSHIKGRSQHREGLLLRIIQCFAESKIPEFDHPVVQKYVFGFYVPVDNILFVEHSESI